jgi:hypothetical protein
MDSEEDRNCGKACRKAMESCLFYDNFHSCDDHLGKCLSYCDAQAKSERKGGPDARYHPSGQFK